MTQPLFRGVLPAMITPFRNGAIDEDAFVALVERQIAGATDPVEKATPGTIRGDFCIDVGRNIIHGSDAVEAAQREIGLWFPEGLAEFTPAMKAWIYE